MKENDVYYYLYEIWFLFYVVVVFINTLNLNRKNAKRCWGRWVIGFTHLWQYARYMALILKHEQCASQLWGEIHKVFEDHQVPWPFLGLSETNYTKHKYTHGSIRDNHHCTITFLLYMFRYSIFPYISLMALWTVAEIWVFLYVCNLHYFG